MSIEKDFQKSSFTLILHAGNARSLSLEAIQLAKNGKFHDARLKMRVAEEEFVKAHQEQTALIEHEAQGTAPSLTLIMVHAQDHVMTAMTIKEIANEFIDMYEKIEKTGVK